MWQRFLLLVAVLALALGSGANAYAITDGQPDGSQHPFVAMVVSGELFCSGVAISETKVVTASHCAMLAGGAGSGGSVSVTFNAEGLAGTAVWHDGVIYPHPEFCLFCGPGWLAMPRLDTHDVAVIVLDQPVSLPSYALLPTLGLVDLMPMKTDLQVVGYGIHGWARDGGNPFDDPVWDFTRYVASTQLVASPDAQSDEYVKLTANPGRGKGGVCFGDSGGPALLGHVVLAVTSYGPGNNPNCTGVAYSNRLDLAYALDFIASQP